MDKENAKKTAETLKAGSILILVLGIVAVIFLTVVTISLQYGFNAADYIAGALQALCFIMLGILLLMVVGFSFLFVFLSSYLKLKAEKKDND